MIFAELPVAKAAGALLAHSQIVAGKRWAKGRVLDSADIAAATAAGIATLTVARLEPGDIGEDEAAARLAAALAGTGLAALPAAHGRANIAATADGLLQIDAATIAAANAVDEALTIGTLPPLARVTAGEIVATVKVIRYAVPGGVLAAAEAAAEAAAAAEAVTVAAPLALALAPFRSLGAALIATSLGVSSDKSVAKTIAVTRARIAGLGGTVADCPTVAHDAAALAAAIAAAPGGIVLIAGASATVDRGDVIPQAILAAGGRVERLGMPVDPGNLLCLGFVGDRAIIGLPGCARSPKRNGLDFVLERLAAGLAVTSADIAAMGVGGLLPEAERPQPRAVATPPQRCGAIILAAGRSSRMGPAHKLLEDWRSRPIVAHVADAVLAAGLPALVVLGARSADVRASLGNRPLRFVTAADHDEGLSASLRAGLAAMPADWDAALVCLGDMPRIEPELLRALAAAPGGVAVPVWQGRRGNPVRWTRAELPALMALTGDVGGKAVLAGLAPTEVDAPSDAIHDDIDTPAALAALRARD